MAYKPTEPGADEQGTTPFRVKNTNKDIIDAEDADQKEFMQGQARYPRINMA
jgi:hypothetical protein